MSTRAVGPYDLGAVLGRGSVGIVYEAVHRTTSARVAMKQIDRVFMTDPTIGPRLKREIAIMKLLDHPNVVSVCFNFYWNHCARMKKYISAFKICTMKLHAWQRARSYSHKSGKLRNHQ